MSRSDVRSTSVTKSRWSLTVQPAGSAGGSCGGQEAAGAPGGRSRQIE